MTHPLQHLVVSNFRTLRGEVSIPLDANVVLIHGPNGSGKTSLLSAIEIAMTGTVHALRLADESYVQHLPHADGGECLVQLAASSPHPDPAPAPLRIEHGRVVGSPLLSSQDARHFAERSVLAQSTLGRLLDIYQQAGDEAESPLVRFVNELLGLDALDNLITGLHLAGHERRLRNALPALAEVHNSVETLQADLDRASTQTAGLRTAVLRQFNDVLIYLGRDGGRTEPPSDVELDELAALVRPNQAEDLVPRLTDYLGQLADIEERIAQLPTEFDAADTVRARAREADDRVERWRATAGLQLEALLERVSHFVQTPLANSEADPSEAWTEANEAVRAERVRLRQAMEQDSAAAAEVDRLARESQAEASRLEVIETQLASLDEASQGLLEALLGIAPHANSDHCPVCGRDYSEVGGGSLASHLSEVIAAHTEEVQALQVAAQNRAASTARLSRAETALDLARAQRWSDSVRQSADERVRALDVAFEDLTGLAASAALGSDLIRDARVLAVRVRQLEEASSTSQQVASDLTHIWNSVPTTALTERPGSPRDAAARLRTSLEEEIQRLTAGEVAQRQANDRHQELVHAIERLARASQTLTETSRRLRDRQQAEERARTRMRRAREIHHAAERARATRRGKGLQSLSEQDMARFVRSPRPRRTVRTDLPGTGSR